jgi:uroporphyrinogen decarboxylase
MKELDLVVREPLARQQVIDVIERRGCSAIPLVFHKWWGEGLWERYGAQLDEMASKYPDDIFVAWYTVPGETQSTTNNPSYRWGYKHDYSTAARHSIGQTAVLLPDWDELDEFLADFPDPNEPGVFRRVEEQLEHAGDRYKLGAWWRLFHERFWSIRGMENLMLDYYDHMDKLKIVGARLVEFYKTVVDRYAELGFDGIFTSDDLGHQTGPMMSPAIFRELYVPLYEEICGYVHSKGMHFFLHTCGDNTLLLDDLIAAGVDVIHPIQKGCMDEKAVAEKYGHRISFLAGVDVQYLLPRGTVDEVRAGVRELIDTYYKPEGGLLLSAGNGIMGDTPFENIEAMLQEMALYRQA